MSIQIDGGNGLDSNVAQDLTKMCSDSNLIIDIGTKSTQGPDGGTISARGSGAVAFAGAQPNVNDPALPVGTKILAALTNPDPLRGVNATVVIRGLRSNDIAFNNQPIWTSAGRTSPVITRGGQRFVFIDYDVAGCNRGPAFNTGYTAVGQNKQPIEIPTDVTLFHEMVHAAHLLGGITFPNQDAEELETVKTENLYRAQRMLPLRSTDQTVIMGMKLFHAGAASCNTTVPASTKSTTSSSNCFFVAALAAVLGSQAVPDLHYLREFRNNILLNTRSGQDFFATFNKHYYQYGPPIVKAMGADPRMGATFRLALAEPMVQFYRLFLQFPEGNLQQVPEPWRGFLQEVESAFSSWASELPLPESFRNQPLEMAARELGVFLRYCLRDSLARDRYLSELERTGELPLVVENEHDRSGAEQILLAMGQHADTVERILGRICNSLT